MKKLLMLTWLLAGCETKQSAPTSTEYPTRVIEGSAPMSTEFTTRVIEGCDYLERLPGLHDGTPTPYVLTHKGNCRNPIHKGTTP